MNLEQIILSPNTALLVLDVQNDFCAPNGEIGELGLDLSQVPDFIKNLTLILEYARKSQMRIIYTRDIHSIRYDSNVWIEKHSRDGRSPFPRENTWGSELFSELNPQKGELVILKHRYSAFVGTELDKYLRKYKVSNLIITGLYTHVCVESTVRHAHMLDYRIIIPRECIMRGSRPSDLDIHENSLKIMDYYFGDVVSIENVFALLDRRADFANRKGCNPIKNH